jgi:hypothetical protein
VGAKELSVKELAFVNELVEEGKRKSKVDY